MALAALYTQARSEDSQLPLAHGFIVDHKFRPESTQEAERVAERLRAKREIHDTDLAF
jgi:tRNA(Ile)-lysidine synthase